MRAYLVSSIGVACGAALLLPLAPAVSAGQAHPSDSADRTVRAAADTAGAPAPAPGAAPGKKAAHEKTGRAKGRELPGSTQSLPLSARTSDGKDLLSATAGRTAGPERAGQLKRRNVDRFSLVGVVWDDPEAKVDGTIQVRTRATGSGKWTSWQTLESHSDDGPDSATAERRGERARGATAPLWVGDSDGVEVRVVPGPKGGKHAHGTADRQDSPREEALERAEEKREEQAERREERREDAADKREEQAEAKEERREDAADRREEAAEAKEEKREEAAEAREEKREDAVVHGLPKGMSLELVSPGPDPEKRPASAVRHGNPGGPAHGMTAQSVGRTEDADALAAEEPPAEGRSGTGQGTAGRAGPDTDEAPEGTESTGTAPERTAGGNELLEKSAELPALSKDDTEAAYGPELRDAARGHVGPRPGIVTRKGWGADESLREKQFGYTKTVKTAFVHHTATSNNYSCKQAPSIIRSIYRYHVKSSKWRDIGYNFLVDKCGTIYEGRAGGVANPVMGAHTYGFNSNSTGIAVIGSHASAPPTREAVEGVAKLTAWKLGLHGVNAKGRTTVVSGGGTKYPKGRKVTLNTISGHRDGFSTDCPGAKLYGKLGDVRAIAGRLQGR